MTVLYSKEFYNSIEKLSDKIALKRLNILIEKLKQANSFREISNVVPIIKHPELFRIRTGNYRLFVRYFNGEMTILLLEYSKRNEKTYRKYK